MKFVDPQKWNKRQVPKDKMAMRSTLKPNACSIKKKEKKTYE